MLYKVIQIDPHCHLEVTVAQQFISTAAYRNGKRYGWRYYRTIIRSRMCFVQWRHPQWPWSTCQGQTAGNDVSPAREIYVCGMQRPPTTVSHMFSLHEKLSLEILALAEVCILWVLAIFFENLTAEMINRLLPVPMILRDSGDKSLGVQPPTENTAPEVTRPRPDLGSWP